MKTNIDVYKFVLSIIFCLVGLGLLFGRLDPIIYIAVIFIAFGVCGITKSFTKIKKETPNFNDNIEKLRRYKSLLEQEIISQAEFDKLKEEILTK